MLRTLRTARRGAPSLRNGARALQTYGGYLRGAGAASGSAKPSLCSCAGLHSSIGSLGSAGPLHAFKLWCCAPIAMTHGALSLHAWGRPPPNARGRSRCVRSVIVARSFSAAAARLWGLLGILLVPPQHRTTCRAQPPAVARTSSRSREYRRPPCLCSGQICAAPSVGVCLWHL